MFTFVLDFNIKIILKKRRLTFKQFFLIICLKNDSQHSLENLFMILNFSREDTLWHSANIVVVSLISLSIIVSDKIVCSNCMCVYICILISLINRSNCGIFASSSTYKDECVNIPPRFHCEMCPSKFRRKYHLVRHLSSKHGIIVPPTPPHVKSTTTTKIKKEKSDSKDLSNLLLNNFDKFSVEALMMKQENLPSGLEPASELSDVSFAHLGLQQTALSELNNDAMAQLGLQQTFQNLKNLFVNYTLNNVSN